jgi:hypothetical protein
MTIVSATGTAQAASKNRSRKAFATEMEAVTKAAVLQAEKEGVVYPEVVQARINSARLRVREKYRRLDAASVS